MPCANSSAAGCNRQALQAGIAGLLPPGFACAVLPIGADYPLHPDEAGQIARAVPVRRREFAAGRAALRAAIAAAGLDLPPDYPIPAGPDRCPRLPTHITASLAHDRELALAVAGPAGGTVAGIDIEPLDAATDRLAGIVAPFDGCDALSAFVGKEAAYKAQFAVTRQMLEFGQVALTARGSAFVARTPWHRLRGAWVRSPRHIVALAILRLS